MSAQNRSSPQAKENRTDNPFIISYGTSSPAEQTCQRATKRKVDDQREEEAAQVQTFPFEPSGRFKTHDTMDLHYTVEPRKRWLDMAQYRSFFLNRTAYSRGDFVYVANESTVKRQKATASMTATALMKKLQDDWVALILEIRAVDKYHVYARIYWMYRPDELPPCTMNSNKTRAGRQPYHGQNELVVSNHMDVIDVLCVTAPANVSQWVESEEDTPNGLYWRQAYSWRTRQLSSIDLICKCQTPANPDKTLIGCTNNDCGKWMHHECLHHDVLTRVYERLGTDRHHVKDLTVTRDESAELRTRSLTDKRDKEAQPTNVKSSEVADNAVIKRPEDDAQRPTQTPAPAPRPAASDSVCKSRPLKKVRRRKVVDQKPYEGLFEASLKMSEGPTAWEIKDLRVNIPSDGEKVWLEQAHCLLCGTTID